MRKKLQSEGEINAEQLKQRIIELLEETNSFAMKFVDFFLSTFNGLYVVSGKNTSQSSNHLPNAIDDIKSFVWFLNELFWQFFSTLNIPNIQKLYGVHQSTLSDYIHRKVHRTFFSLYERAVCRIFLNLYKIVPRKRCFNLSKNRNFKRMHISKLWSKQ